MIETNVRPESDSLKDAYTVAEVSQIMGMKERSTYKFCSETRDFIVKRVGPRLLRIHKQSFDSWWNTSD